MTINTVIIDKSDSSAEIISSKLFNLDGFKVIDTFKDIDLFDINIKDIDLVFFDISFNEADRILNKIKDLQNKNPKTIFVALSYEINSELVTKTLGANVKDFLLKPLIDSIFNATIKKIIEIKENKKQKFSKVVCFYSNKGGVGKTSIIVNSAYELANFFKDEKVCILDLNYNCSDTVTFLNVEQKYNIDYIIEKLENASEELILSLLSNYNDTNLYIFPLENTKNTTSLYSSNVVPGLINRLRNIFDWIIIDTSNDINEMNLSVFNSSDIIILTGLANMISIRNCQKMLEIFDDAGFNDNKIKLLINRYLPDSKITIENIEKTTGKSVFEKIPNDYLAILDAMNMGKVVSEVNPQSNISRAYKQLAQKIISIDYLDLNETNKNSYNHGIFNLLRRMGG